MNNYKTFVIRLQVKKGSQEEQLLEFLNNEAARPFSKPQMVLLALKSFWLTLSLAHNKHPTEQLLASLNQGVYLWKLQEQYLRKIVGVEFPAPTTDDLKGIESLRIAELPPNDEVEQRAFQPFGDIVSIK
ncbi:hypothetical protein [Nostoc sp. FACHB-110]|uniref:hypothetical protein n=1 Tax=Nostoc sp. FACHB-110 TaxID=2692834 RepID=UPI001682A738|nr:hypothetical protein [Nostoc sp. FACHB-110]MBD2440564.1 hypothetical protein [Nostoc sp. FACHB-110]